MIARVLPLTQTRAVQGLFDYILPSELSEGVTVGSLLRVPFAGRPIQAVVAEITPESELPIERLARVQALLPARLPKDLVDLAQWMAREYCSTAARALRVMLPPGALRGLAEKRVLMASLTVSGRSAMRDGSRLTVGQRVALEALTGGGPLPAAKLGTPLLRRLQARGLVTLEHQVSSRRPTRHQVSSAAALAPRLTAEQEAALGPLLNTIAEERVAFDDRPSGGCQNRDGLPAPFLLHGVTGSGKTEVYLQAAAATLESGRSVIVLVPEIGLTPQALARFAARFGEVVAVMHSGMSEGRRLDEWLRLARGEARICVGPRSAIFAPLQNVGLIVVDEEHESSYKHEGDPRYDARGVAEQRAAVHGAVLLYGSATPRPESIHCARRLRLSRRVDGRPLPDIEILDMRALHHPLHPHARLALADCRRGGGKAVVLLNRRGWSNFLSCGSCGRVWMCPNCDVALVMHRADGLLSCHHCGHRERIPASCPDCGSTSVARHGAGTERLEHELMSALATPDFPVMRLDADAAGVDARARKLARFDAAKQGVLVGTQMIAKGHDFADVGLGIVIDADQTLRFPDFRAEERTFALITQLAGRTGRGGRGRVLVQTMEPQASCIQLAAQHDADGFLRGELERRRALSYPPFSTLIRVLCSSPQDGPPATAAAALRQRIDLESGHVLGPAPLFMLRGRYRSQLVIKAAERRPAIAAVRAAVDAIVRSRAHRAVAISVDVDPQ